MIYSVDMSMGFETQTAVTPGGRVLMIDDEITLLRSYERGLRKLFDVVAAPGGKPALEILERDRSFDVIVCDVMMPQINGAGVFAYIEAEAPELVPRVIFCTGGPVRPELASWLAATTNVQLAKPVDLHLLRSTIARVRDENTVIG